MYFDELPTNVPDEELMIQMAQHPFCNPIDAEFLLPWKDKKRTMPELPFGTLNRLFHALRHRCVANAEHLQQRFVSACALGEASVSPAAVTVRVAGVTERFEPARGYMVKPAETSAVLRNHVADVLSYVYTPPSKEGIVGVLRSNFAAVKPSVAIPVITMESRGYDPKLWKASDASHNAVVQVSLMKDSAALGGAIRGLKEMYKPFAGEYEGKLFRTMAIGNKKVEVPIPFLPRTICIKDVSLAWRFLSVHRQARAEDGKWISPMTSGYYLGGFNRAMDRAFWVLTDVLSTFREVKASSVYFVNKPNAVVAASLAANKIPVFVASPEVVCSKVAVDKDNCALPGVYTIYLTTPVPEGALIVYDSPKERPVIKQKEIVYPTVLDETLRGLAEMKGLIMTWAFLTPTLYQHKCVVRPSAHVHAGHAIAIFGTEAVESVSLEKLTQRFAVANIVKTWFPIARTRFYEVDLVKFGIRLTALQAEMVMRFRSVSDKKYTVFGQYEDEPEIAVENEGATQVLANSAFEEKIEYKAVRPPPVPKQVMVDVPIVQVLQGGGFEQEQLDDGDVVDFGELENMQGADFK